MRLQLILGVFLTSLLASCASDTGMIISTSTSEDFDGDVTTLRYYIGESNLEFQGLSDQAPLEDIDVSNLDLATAPFRLLLRPSKESGSVKVVAVAFDSGGNISGFGELPDMVHFVPDRVIQWDLVIESPQPDVVITPTDCLRWMSDGEWTRIGVGDDRDCDGSLAPEDCNDLDPNQSPDNPEICDNNRDDNCNGDVDLDDTTDEDDDGFPACDPDANLRDCNDNDPNVKPGATERCDAVDNNCDGACDEGFDSDHDGVSLCGSIVEYTNAEGASSCAFQGTLGPVDCDNDDPAAFPGNPELCDGIDNNCSEQCFDEAEFDTDGDGFTRCEGLLGSIVGECSGAEEQWHDCNDNKKYVHPGAHDLCDGYDNNCDGITDPLMTPCFEATGVESTCFGGMKTCTDGAPTGLCMLESEHEGFDSGWCDSYEGCTTTSFTPDSFVCSLEHASVNSPIEVCDVHMESPGVMCPGSPVPIILPGVVGPVSDCSYRVIGGSLQQGYEVGFAMTDTITEVWTGCNGMLSVALSPAGEWPGSASFAIQYQDDAVTNDMELNLLLKPKLVSDCTGMDNLACTSWVP